MTRTCIIGGSGFIGRRLLRLLREHDRSVVVVGRRRESPFDPSIEYHSVAADNARGLNDVLRSADEVIDVAYSTWPQTSFQDPIKDILENLTQSVRNFEALIDTAVKRVVYVSSGGTVYGQAVELPIREDHPTNPVSPYGITKLAIEKYGLMFHATNHLPLIVVRPSNAYGEGQVPFRGQGFVATAVAACLRGESIKVFGSEGATRDYIHVDDVASGIVAALLHGLVGGVYNVGTGLGTTNIGILNELRPMLAAGGHDIDIEFLPARAFDVKVNVLNADKLFAASGWRPTVPLNVGLKRTVEWLSAQSAATDASP
jgi:UDP-glucose 4-epimerase